MHIKLRDLQEKDAPYMYEWMQDSAVTAFMRQNFAALSLLDCQHFIKHSWLASNTRHYAIVNADDEYLGTVSLKNIYDGYAEFAIVIRKCVMGKGVAQAAMQGVCKLAFEQLGLKEVYWYVAPENDRAIKFYRKNQYAEFCMDDNMYSARTGKCLFTGGQQMLWFRAESFMSNFTQQINALKDAGFSFWYMCVELQQDEQQWLEVVQKCLLEANKRQILVLDILTVTDKVWEQNITKELQKLENDRILLHSSKSEVECRAVVQLMDNVIITEHNMSWLKAAIPKLSVRVIDAGLFLGNHLVISDSAKKAEYDISVCVLTYNPDFKKLLSTLKSIICQKQCSFEIIISDDGSRCFPKKELMQWFRMFNFTDYTILLHPKNGGTVKNVYDGLKATRGKYVKAISPGDYLYDENVLAGIIDFLEEQQLRVAFGRTCQYRVKEGCYSLNDFMYPMDIDAFRNKDYTKILENVFVYSDYICGAAYTSTREVMLKYMPYLIDNVVYAEDLVYMLILSEGIEIGFWDNNFVWYEIGSGISNSGSKGWGDKMAKDNIAARNIIRKLHPDFMNIMDSKCNGGWLQRYLGFQKEIIHRMESSKLSFLEKVDINKMRPYVIFNQDEKCLIKLSLGNGF